MSEGDDSAVAAGASAGCVRGSATPAGAPGSEAVGRRWPGSWWPADEPVVVHAEGLVLREWSVDDVPTMVHLFDTEEMNRWTPLASPFNAEVAAGYVARAHRLRREDGTIQLAVTVDGREPLGEVLAFDGGEGTVEVAYAVGAPYQRQGLARRSVAAMLAVAATAGVRAARLTIASDNIRSQRVALATGFHLTEAPATRRSRKGFLLSMQTWERSLGEAGRCRCWSAPR